MLKFNKILSDPKIEITALEISRNPFFLIFSVRSFHETMSYKKNGFFMISPCRILENPQF